MFNFNRFLFQIFLAHAFVIIGISTSFSDEREPEFLRLSNIKSNWPYFAFSAIPRIEEIKPILVLETNEDGLLVGDGRCLKLHYYQIKKKYDISIVLEDKSLHELACISMKRAINRTVKNGNTILFGSQTELGLEFDFYKGLISVIEIPNPPLDPEVLLEDIFWDSVDPGKIGILDLPQEYEPEITETKI